MPQNWSLLPGPVGKMKNWNITHKEAGSTLSAITDIYVVKMLLFFYTKFTFASGSLNLSLKQVTLKWFLVSSF